MNGIELGITYLGGAGHDVVLTAESGSVTPLPTGTATLSPTAPGSVTPPSETATPTATPSPTETGGPNACRRLQRRRDGRDQRADPGRQHRPGEHALSADCPAFDVNGDSRVTITELIQAVGNALEGC